MDKQLMNTVKSCGQSAGAGRLNTSCNSAQEVKEEEAQLHHGTV